MLRQPRFKTVSVFGLGYIGLPTAAAFAQRKIKVIGVDVNADAVETINKGKVHIVEPDLDDAVYKAVNEGFLEATISPRPADAFLIAVPTPLTGDHTPDLSYIETASRMIAPALKAGDLVVLESTSPVGATEKMAAWMAEQRPDLSFPHQNGEISDIRIAHCPERVLPGRVMREIISNDRVIGGMTSRCAEEASQLYRIFVQGNCLTTDVRTAEMCKLAENAYRDVNIAYANELSLVCDRLGIDVWELIRLANRHPRVDILQPGPGVGGHCIAVDPWFIVAAAPEDARLIRTAREVNDAKPEQIAMRIRASADAFRRKHGRRPVVAALGLTFKADIDDLRESPAVRIVAELATDFSDLIVVEPHIAQLPATLTGCRLLELDQAIREADVLVILVRHRIFGHYFGGLKAPLAKIVIDTVGLTPKIKHQRPAAGIAAE